MSTQPAGLIVLESSNNTEDAGGIYQNLASHQRAEKWFGRDLVTALQEWAERFIVEFRLDIAELAVCVDRLPVSRLGHFRIGHNGFGLKGEIAINVRYLTDRESFWRVLGTLLHELLHAWQHTHGKASTQCHHNREFRDKARELGLVVDGKGVTSFAADSRFKELLRRNGITVPDGEIKATPRKAGSSKMRKWSCGCTTVRTGVGDFQAQCLKCNNRFQRDS
jgi:hypothetical protein